ncbi:MAG: dTDP-glucose 4,6-dehydratase [Acidobacteriia bacterium]|nr:dTDP-glucose 4,6-dehydratase [Terriglobia bacterium]
METMLVTGGAGFIGSNFVRHALRQTGDRVVVLDKLTYAGSLESLAEVAGDPSFAFVLGDIADREVVASVFRDHGPSSVVNFAAESHVDRSIDGPRPFVETNIVGAFELLEASRRHAASLDEVRRGRFRFLHVSTDEVYGSLGPEGLFTEETPYNPNSPYAASKAAADHLVRAFHETYGLATIITNCSNNYGPFQFPEKLIPLMILNALEGKPLPIYGDGGNVRDWLYVLDHCEGILLALREGRPGGKYNIGGSNERRNVEIVDRICEVLDREVPPTSNAALASRGVTTYRSLKTFVPDRPGHDRRYAIDATLIREELGWKPAHDFESGIEETVRWYLSHRDWCEKVQSGRYARERLGLSTTPGGERKA